MKDLLILGIGNPYISDDGVGIHVTRRLQRTISDPRVECKEFCNSGFDAISLLDGYQSVIVIDAAKTGKVPKGQYQILSHHELTALAYPYSLHTFGFLSAIQLGSILSLPLPSSITVFAIEVSNTEIFGEECSPEVASAVPLITQSVLEHIKKMIPDINLLQEEIIYPKSNFEYEIKPLCNI